MEKAKRGPDTAGQGSQRATSDEATTLHEIGVSKTQSSRWQKLAEVSDEQCEASLADLSLPCRALAGEEPRMRTKAARAQIVPRCRPTMTNAMKPLPLDPLKISGRLES
jgi:hypothetical protein